jgi:hypothetical protein
VYRVKANSRLSVVEEMHVEERHGGELLEYYSRRETGGALPEQLLQGDVQAIGHEGDEDVAP